MFRPVRNPPYNHSEKENCGIIALLARKGQGPGGAENVKNLKERNGICRI
jgi:hypothetical protein